MTGGWMTGAAVCCCATLFFSVGCVERTLIILTDPPDVQVFVDGKPVEEKLVDGRRERFVPTPGTSADQQPERELGVVRIPFEQYAVREITLTRIGYESQTHYIDPQPPLWEHFPFDIVTEVLLPVTLQVEFSYRFTLEPAERHSYDQTYERARVFRDYGAGALNRTQARHGAELAPFGERPEGR